METLRQQAYRIIKDKIVCLQIKPGERLFEADLAKDVNLGRTPVREAILMLENEKLVECNDKQGYIVRKLSREEAYDFFAIRMVIEDFAIPLVVKGLTDDIIAELERNIEKVQGYIEKNDFPNIIRYESEFHEILYRTTNSKVFLEITSGIVDKFQWLRAIALSAPGGARTSLEEHRGIFSAYKARDIAEIRRLTELHIRNAREKFASMEHIVF
ncbi:MAG TPA: GntR family transcriptional regulator [Syntrophorhabdaceae bacterium]|nr:GntR family transcriptional regulator [Syntrophorhabdaceae bacterium]HQM81920.1 GntR family transcriptional regulator [Syntrophorhabdaceae bacterium]